MDRLIAPIHFFGILSEYRIYLTQDSRIFEVDQDFDGTLHLEVDSPGKPYSLLTLQMRDKKIIYNKILEWKLATHYKVPDKVLLLLASHFVIIPT